MRSLIFICVMLRCSVFLFICLTSVFFEFMWFCFSIHDFVLCCYVQYVSFSSCICFVIFVIIHEWVHVVHVFVFFANMSPCGKLRWKNVIFCSDLQGTLRHDEWWFLKGAISSESKNRHVGSYNNIRTPCNFRSWDVAKNQVACAHRKFLGDATRKCQPSHFGTRNMCLRKCSFPSSLADKRCSVDTFWNLTSKSRQCSRPELCVGDWPVPATLADHDHELPTPSRGDRVPYKIAMNVSVFTGVRCAPRDTLVTPNMPWCMMVHKKSSFQRK